jgi:hypothetical protein
VPTTVPSTWIKEAVPLIVIIGVDPHKATHTAVAIDDGELELGTVQVRATDTQVKRLLAWAAPFGERIWAVEGAGGCGYLPSQQLVAAGETVLNVPATLAARVRVLGTGRSNKNDPNDARSVAIAALRSPGLAAVSPPITRRCYVCSLAATTSSRRAGPAPLAGSMRCSRIWFRADQPRNSRPIALSGRSTPWCCPLP